MTTFNIMAGWPASRMQEAKATVLRQSACATNWFRFLQELRLHMRDQVKLGRKLTLLFRVIHNPLQPNARHLTQETDLSRSLYLLPICHWVCDLL
jgi:hypothetical protein